MKRPLFRVAIGYTGGVLMAGVFRPPVAILFSAGLALILAALLFPRLRPFLLWSLVVVCGWTNLAWRQAILSPFDLRVVMGESADIVRVRGTLLCTPSPRAFTARGEERLRSVGELETKSLQRRGAEWQPAVGSVIVTTPGEPPAGFYQGQTVELEGVLDRPPGLVAEGLFDYRGYLENEGVDYRLQVGSTNDWLHLTTPGAVPFSDRFLKWAEGTLARGLHGRDDALRLLWSMTLGYRGIPHEYYDPFVATGTMHVFAISGMHIALATGILAALLECLRVPRRWCGVVIIPLIWFYTAATGWQPSAVRSTVMMTVIVMGWVLVRPSDLLNSLGMAALVILLWEPRELFGASFQLSFVVVLSLAVLVPELAAALGRLTAEEALLPEELKPWWRKALRAPLRWWWLSLATSVAAWLGSWPLISYYFHLVSPVTLAANLVIIPLSSAALACNLGSLIGGSWVPQATELFNWSAWFWMQCMIRLSEWFTVPAWASWHVRGLDRLEIGVYYAVLGLSGWGWMWWLRECRGPAMKRAGLGLGAAVAIGVCICGWRWISSVGVTELSVLPFEGGWSMLCDRPGRAQDWLIDTGSAKAADRFTIPFLHARGMDRLPKLILTHGDTAHAGGAGRLLDVFGETKIVVSSTRFRSPVYRQVLARAGTGQKTGTSRPRITAERTAEAGRVLPPWTVVYPGPGGGHFARADDNSMVLKGQFDGLQVLVVPDLGSAGQTALLEMGADLGSDIVIASPPLGAEPLQEELLQAIRPAVIILCDGEAEGREAAKEHLKKRLERWGKVVYTSQAGAVKLSLGRSGWQIVGFDGKGKGQVLGKGERGRRAGINDRR